MNHIIKSISQQFPEMSAHYTEKVSELILDIQTRTILSTLTATWEYLNQSKSILMDMRVDKESYFQEILKKPFWADGDEIKKG